MSRFEILNTDRTSAGRRGLMTTAHGTVETPAFMPVGTSGAVKGVAPWQLAQSGAQMVLANTYHLLLRPGIETVEKLGGLHKFMGWQGPILTDSGGYQVFSLSSLTKIDDDGVVFSSHVDGTEVYLSAETATEIQNRLGADIIMCFDECAAFGCSASELKKAVERTIRWASRCKQSHANREQMLFGIVQGGTNLDLRRYCVGELVEMEFDGYAIGGLSVGEGREQMTKTVFNTASLLPENKPRYVMGVGMPTDILLAVEAGVDMFDCVLPTRNGRNAFAFTEDGPLRLRNSVHIESTEPVQAGCDCCCCRHFSRGTIRHFFNVAEMLGPILLSLHNLRFYQRLMTRIRQALESGNFGNWAREQLGKYERFGPLQKNQVDSANSL